MSDVPRIEEQAGDSVDILLDLSRQLSKIVEELKEVNRRLRRIENKMK